MQARKNISPLNESQNQTHRRAIERKIRRKSVSRKRAADAIRLDISVGRIAMGRLYTVAQVDEATGEGVRIFFECLRGRSILPPCAGEYLAEKVNLTGLCARGFPPVTRSRLQSEFLSYTKIVLPRIALFDFQWRRVCNQLSVDSLIKENDFDAALLRQFVAFTTREMMLQKH